MPLSDGSIVQRNFGSTGASAAAATVVVSLGSATTAGNTVIAILETDISMTTLSGWTLDLNVLSGGGDNVNVYRKGGSGYAGGETSWTFATTVSTTKAVWTVLEIEGLSDDPLDVTVKNATTATPQTSGTTALNSAYDSLCLAIHAGKNTAGAVGSWSGQTGGFTEIGESTTSASGSNSAMAVSTLFPGDVGTFSSTGTKTGTFNTSVAAIVIYRSATSPLAASLFYHTGFEFGTHAGLTTGSTGARIADTTVGTLGTNIIVQAGSAKNGSYGLRTVASAASVNVQWSQAQALPALPDTITASFWVRVVSSSGVAVIWQTQDNATAISCLQLVYDTTSTKLGVRWVTGAAPGTAGSTTSQSGTLAANTWTLVDITYYGSKSGTNSPATSYRGMAWSVDGVAQTPLTNLTGLQVSGVVSVSLGTNNMTPTTHTLTADYDDYRMSSSKIDHPLGDQRVLALKVDAAGTVTISGTTTNFRTFTANGTLAAWNAATALTAVDELPPTIGATADGAAQNVAAASDYMQFPMETYTLAAGERVVAVRAVVPGWDAGTTTIGLRGFDGTTEKVLFAAADPTFSNSTTAPGWLSKQWVITPRWTQAQLDAAALRLGFGTTAVAVGAHALYLEVVIGATTSLTLFGDQATAGYDPAGNYAVVNVTAAASQAGDASLYYETATVPTTVPIPADTTVTTTLDSATAATTNYIAFYPPPEGVPDA